MKNSRLLGVVCTATFILFAVRAQRANILATESGVLGIEVTQLYQPKGAAKFARRAVESFHQKVVHRAKELYCQAGGAPMDVRVYYIDHRGGQCDVDTMANSLA